MWIQHFKKILTSVWGKISSFLDTTISPTLGREILDKLFLVGQWLCLSWQNGRFRYQRSAVRIQSLAKVYLYRTFVYCQLCIEKTEKKKKRGKEWTIFKKKTFFGLASPSVTYRTSLKSQDLRLQIDLKIGKLVPGVYCLCFITF